MTNHFDQIIDRRSTECYKWNCYEPDVLPMWVADMDFPAPDGVIQALQERVAHGVFGYPKAQSSIREAVVQWLAERHQWEVDPEWLVLLPGVVPAFRMAALELVSKQEGIIIQTPVYPPILKVAGQLKVVDQAMQLTRSEDGAYRIDWDAFSAAFGSQDDAPTRLFILCNPHNPVGRVFRRDELEKMAAECLRRDVIICSDEIHCDLVYSGYRHIPIASLDPDVADRTITLMAPSKTFNIAGLQSSFAIIPNRELRRRIQHAGYGLVEWVNVLGQVAMEAAYRTGEPWLDELLVYLESNRDFVSRFVENELPGIQMSPVEGTYLAWLDCRGIGIQGSPQEFFLKEGRVAFNEGASFGPGGEGFVRLNFGCPRAILSEALERMKSALSKQS